MTSVDFITELFCKVDDMMQNIPNHSQADFTQANWSPSEYSTPSKA